MRSVPHNLAAMAPLMGRSLLYRHEMLPNRRALQIGDFQLRKAQPIGIRRKGMSVRVRVLLLERIPDFMETHKRFIQSGMSPQPGTSIPVYAPESVALFGYPRSPWTTRTIKHVLSLT